MVSEGQIDEAFADKFWKTLYMDDSINGGENVGDAYDSYKKSKILMESAGFLLRKWRSNSDVVMNLIRTSENDSSAEYTTSAFGPTSHLASVLGYTWDTITDEVIFDLSKIIEMAETRKATKSNVLSTVASIFDPVGYLAPITSRGKVIFQFSCKSKIKWDEMR